jgi:tripartite ATP-independent transporter DctP family solute receptor
MPLKRKVLLLVYSLVALGCIIGVYSSTSERAEFTIKFATQGSTIDEDYIGLMALKDYVEKTSNGRVDVQVFPSGQFCGNIPECIGNLQKGVLEVFSTTAGGTGNFFGPAQVLDLPYIFDNDEQAECVLDGPIMAEMRDVVLASNLNIRLMGVSNTGGWRNFATVTKPIHHPDDLKGQKIRTTPASIQQELVRQLGANPTPVSWSELYTALATGVVEGSKNGIQDIIGAKLEEHLKFIVLDGHSYMAALWWFSEPVWQSLPADIQQILIEGFAIQRNTARQTVFEQEARSYQIFEEAGGIIHRPSPEQKLAFKQASKNMRQWFTESYDAKWLKLLDSSVKKCDSLGAL